MTLCTLPRMRAMYSMLRKFPPFAGWKLPAVEQVRFYLSHELKQFGEYNTSEQGVHRIGLNPHLCVTLGQIERVMAHEMVHLKQEMLGRRPATRDDQHNRAFFSLAHFACRKLGFDPGAF